MKNILWLDNDKKLLDASEEIFQDHGFKVIKATNTSRALTILRTRALDGVLLDVRLNGGENGLELLEEIRYRHPELAVAICTAYPDAFDQIVSERLGASFYLEKILKPFPIDRAELDRFFESLHLIFTTKPTLSKSKSLSQNAFLKGCQDTIDWDTINKKLESLPRGKKFAAAYENLIEDIFSKIFSPSLSNPRKQHGIHSNSKRIDITYANEAENGFFAWLAQHYCAPFIFVECKNYGEEIGNPELDQLSGRFSSRRGQFGILACRSVKDVKSLNQSCVNTATDQRGFIIVLTDEDIFSLIENVRKNQHSQEFTLLRRKFELLVN